MTAAAAAAIQVDRFLALPSCCMIAYVSCVLSCLSLFTTRTFVLDSQAKYSPNQLRQAAAAASRGVPPLPLIICYEVDPIVYVAAINDKSYQLAAIT